MSSPRRTTKTLDQISADLVTGLNKVAVNLPDDAEVREAWTFIETYCAVAQHVLAQANPSKIQAAVTTVTIQQLMKV